MKLLYSFCLLFFITINSQAQNHPATVNYDLKKKRLLIHTCSSYLYNSNQGSIDADSSVVLTCKAYKLPLALAYDEGFNDGSFLIGSKLIENGNITAAKQLYVKSKEVEKIKLALQLGIHYLFQPFTKPEDITNANIYISEAVKISNELKIQKWQHESLMLLGKYYFQINNYPESKKCFLQVVTECRKTNDKTAIADALYNQASYQYDLDPEKEKILKEAEALYTTLGQEEKVLQVKSKLCTIYFWHGKINDAKKILYQNIAAMRKIGFRQQQFSETTISYIEGVQFNIKNALYYALKSVETMEKTNDYTFADIFYMRLGIVYLQMGHTDEAIKMSEKSIKYGQSIYSSGSWYKSFITATASLSEKGKNKEAIEYMNSITSKYAPPNKFDNMLMNYGYANCYWRIKNYGTAEKYFIKAGEAADALDSPQTHRDVCNTYSAIALFYGNRKNLQKTKLYIDKIETVSKKYNKTYNSEALQLSFVKLDSLKGDFKSALAHHKLYKIMSDSLLDYAKNKQIEELRIQYETENKEQKIKLLDKETDLQETALKKSKLINTLSIWSLVLLVLFIALLYNRYRLKQRTNAELELKEKEINQKNINLRHLLDEKEWLLKEIHHRVKNNLQTVISLLNSQSAYLENDMALSAIKNSQHRIHSMSLIHQKLYNSENISTINMPNYIRELVEYLRESFSLGQRIRFELKIDPLELDVAQAVPLGLILNEAITNSIKYAFPEDRTGMIYITLETTKENKILLTIADNGIGFDTDISAQKINSFGLSLIKGLSDDLDANFSMENNNGTIFKIEFSKEFPIIENRR
ncbi:two-component sensor histidine kinase [Flavobacterium cutihirudinis]|uniref:histidine kinase n=1 Tax=Flavobacterium cutihirudinis TaxID=1265740 RepID=A0A3D9FQH0_9FLAO|nr:sensor histidine kinase [Flavobacterium cutihirudinis]RED22693.1 two-component sensor histidine kinase [Flavobacterium cutihirudinis]